jgi:hypothetical protein
MKGPIKSFNTSMPEKIPTIAVARTESTYTLNPAKMR